MVGIQAAVVMLVVSGGAADAPAAEEPVDYLGVVRAYADALLEHGRDHYGEVNSPLIAATLDRSTLSLLEGEALNRVATIPREQWGMRPHDRMLTGANPMHDQNLYQVLYALSKATRQRRYAKEADNTLEWFFNHCQSPDTGLMAWGEHIGWDFHTETIIEKGAGTTHEYFRPWVLWDRSLKLAPDACERFALGVWEHQISDHETGNFSRHARYDTHGPGTNSEYPRHGGFYIATWASAYAHTENRAFLNAIETLLTYFDGRRSPQSDAIPAESAQRSKGEMIWPPSNLSLAVDLWEAAGKVPEPLAARMRESALRTDRVFLKLPHDLAPDGKGFLKIANTHTLDTRQWGDRGAYTRLWATGYGDATDAAIANLCMLRYRQINREDYRDLVLAAAERYMTGRPDLSYPVYPGTLGEIILLMLAAHEITGDAAYLDRADELAQEAVALFFDASSPLPKASTAHDHYEAITRADTLMMALLDLWTTRNRPRRALALVYNDR
jgi:hypothetical protein